MVLIDASSAILIYKAGLFDVLLSAYNLGMTPAVVREVSVSGRAGASAFQQALGNRRLQLLEPFGPADLTPDLERMGAGERELLAACSADIRFVIIDDRKAAMYCRQNAIPYINALLCAKVLHVAGYIDAGIYHHARELMCRIGRYAEDIVHYVQTCHAEQLMRFFPEKSNNNKYISTDIKSFIK